MSYNYNQLPENLRSCELAMMKLSEVRRYLYTSGFSDADIKLVMEKRRKLKARFYTKKCRNKENDQNEEIKVLVACKDKLLIEKAILEKEIAIYHSICIN